MQDHPENPDSDFADSDFEQRIAEVEARSRAELERLASKEKQANKSAKFSREQALGKAIMPIFTMLGALLVGTAAGWLVDGFRFGPASTVGAFFGVIGGTALMIYRLTRT